MFPVSRPIPFLPRLCLSIVLAVFVGASSASADELRLANGDRISGRIVSLVNGLLTLQTPGEIRTAVTLARNAGVPIRSPLTSPATGARVLAGRF